ncbi:hypothetical protein D3C72_2352100 [compost metagenome]
MRPPEARISSAAASPPVLIESPATRVVWLLRSRQNELGAIAPRISPIKGTTVAAS